MPSVAGTTPGAYFDFLDGVCRWKFERVPQNNTKTWKAYPYQYQWLKI